MTEAYTNLDNTTKWYQYGSDIPFNFNLITEVVNSSKPNDFKKVIDDWMARTPPTGSANWVVMKIMFFNDIFEFDNYLFLRYFLLKDCMRMYKNFIKSCGYKRNTKYLYL